MTKIKLSILLVLCCINYAYTQTILPADFPQYKDTGDKKADNAAYYKTKQTWVESNPEAYKKLAEKHQEAIRPIITPPDAAGFPTYHYTGNQAVDDDAYDKAKQQWVKNNPELYKKIGGQITVPHTAASNSEQTVISYEPNKCIEETLMPEIPTNCIVWELTDATVSDKNNQLKTSELTQLRSEIREEFLSETIYWKMSPEGMLYIFYNDKYKGHFQIEKDSKQLTLLPYEETACNNGAKFFPFEKWDNEQIIINVPDEDEGSSLVYQLTFSKSL